MPASRNVAVLLTPPGPAAIAVVRLAGGAVDAFLAAQFSAPVPAGRCVHGTLRDEAGETLDDPLVVRSPDGTWADLNLHGGPWVLRSVLNLAGRAGFRVADAGDVPAVAYDAGDEFDREVMSHLPSARTELAVRTLLAQRHAWDAMKREASPERLAAVLADRSLERLLNPPRVAIVGIPNVGKSTLANQLFGTQRSVTADVPGTTRDWVGDLANFDGLAVMLVDTPGVRDTPDATEREAILRSAPEVDRADGVVLVLDATQPIEPEQGALLRRYPHAVVVVNKIDRAPGWDAVRVDASTVATTGQGVPPLRRTLLAHLGCADLTPGRPRVWSRRQREIVERAIHDPAVLREL